MVAQRQLVDALDQHGQPVPGGQHRLERIGAGAGRAQHETGELGRGEHVELVIATRQSGLDPGAQRRGARFGGDEQADPLGIAALRHQPAKARLHDARLARPGGSEEHQARIGMGRGIALPAGETIEGAVGGRALDKQVHALADRAVGDQFTASMDLPRAFSWLTV